MESNTFTQSTQPVQVSNTAQKRRMRTFVIVALAGIILLGAFLRLYQLGASGYGNEYYAAAVKSMLMSWKNFFFVAAEPGGSVSVDKPPLGLWIQAASAAIFGVNGFALALPQALAGVLSIPLLFSIVKRQFGDVPALIAALVLAVVPVTIATERNNTMDGTLLFMLLLATWAFIKAVRSAKWGWLMLGALFIGLAFNIKMLQAYMVVPALFALYFFFAPHKWWRRMLHLVAATVLMLVISFSWAVAVDLTPAENRPYVGSSGNNSVMGLIFGHNGASRLGLSKPFTTYDPFAANDAQPQNDNPQAFVNPQAGQNPVLPGDDRPQQGGMLPPLGGDRPNNPPADRPFINPQGGQNPLPPNTDRPMQPPQDKQTLPVNQQGGQPGGMRNETGRAGVTRLFTQPLAEEASWLLPLALLALPLLVVVLKRKKPFTEAHQALVLWALWLIPQWLYFSFTTGLFHAYYLIMFGPALAALVTGAAWAVMQLWRKNARTAWWVLVGVAGITLIFQIVVLQNNFSSYAAWMSPVILISALAGLAALSFYQKAIWVKIGSLLLVFSLIFSSLIWSGITAFDVNTDVNLPNAGPAQQTNDNVPVNLPQRKADGQAIMLDYLLQNTPADGYLLATGNANSAAPYILSTGRPVLIMGGFSGADDVISLVEVQQMVANGALRFFLNTGKGKDSRTNDPIQNWVSQTCSPVAMNGNVMNAAAVNTSPLYDCSGAQ